MSLAERQTLLFKPDKARGLYIKDKIIFYFVYFFIAELIYKSNFSANEEEEEDEDEEGEEEGARYYYGIHGNDHDLNLGHELDLDHDLDIDLDHDFDQWCQVPLRDPWEPPAPPSESDQP